MEGKMAQETVELTLVLPNSLAREAEAGGLLTPQSIESMLREELRRRRINRLFKAADQLATLPMPPLTEAEVEVEIQAVRNARRKSNASSG